MGRIARIRNSTRMKNIGRTAGASLALFAAIFLVASPSAFAMSRIEPAIGGVAGGDTIHATDLDIPHMVSISNGYYHTIALTSDNQLYQWGRFLLPEPGRTPRYHVELLKRTLS